MVRGRDYYYRITGIDSKDSSNSLTGSTRISYYLNYTDLAASASTTLNDTSTSPAHNITAASEISEGDSLKWSIKDMINSQYYYYRITGIDSKDTTQD